MKKIKLTKEQLQTLTEGLLKENTIDEFLTRDEFMTGDQFKVLRDALDRGKVVSIAFVKKSGIPRIGVFRKKIAAYQYSDKPKTTAQTNIKDTHGLINVMDINVYKNTLALTGDPAVAAQKSWRYITLANVIGFLADGQFIDTREQNEIRDKFGDTAYNFLSKRMEAAMARMQQETENNPEIVPANEPVNEPEPITELNLQDRNDENLGANEFQISYGWIQKFGGAELLASKYIGNGPQLLKALKDGRITIEEIDAVTNGPHGQVGDIPYSQTTLAKDVIIPYILQQKKQQKIEPIEEEDDAIQAFKKARTKTDESLRTLGFGYHGGLESKGVGRAGNRRDLYENIKKMKDLNKKLNESNLSDMFNPDGDNLVPFEIPEWAISALINDDQEGLTPEEKIKLDKFQKEVVEEFGNAYFLLGDLEGKDDLGFQPKNSLDNLGGYVYRLYIRPDKEQTKSIPQQTEIDEALKIIKEKIKILK